VNKLVGHRMEYLAFGVFHKPVYRVKANSVGRYHAVVDGQLFVQLPKTGDTDHWEHLISGHRFCIPAYQTFGSDRSKITADAMLKYARQAGE
jgi:uncharacterized protein YaiE (UPF0345 family)